MAGRGPAPKPSHRKVRRNADTHAQTVLEFRRGVQPGLPEDIEWHPRTRDWWDMWGASPQADLFSDTDWSFLLDTALMHDAMWSKGQWTLAAEVRLRVAKLGATPEDRQRLRIMFADADEKDSKRTEPSPHGSARERFAELRSLPTPGAGA